MSSRSAVQLGSLVWSFAVIALALKAPRPTAPHDIAPLTARVDPLMLAGSILFHAERLNSAAIGYSGITPPEVLAWHVILTSPNADSVFKALVKTASTPGRMYALVGIRLTDPVAFEKLAASIVSRGGAVPTMDGCVMTTERVSDVVGQIGRGEWVRRLLSAPYQITFE